MLICKKQKQNKTKQNKQTNNNKQKNKQKQNKNNQPLNNNNKQTNNGAHKPIRNVLSSMFIELSLLVQFLQYTGQ